MPLSSADRDAYLALARAMREQLSRVVPLMGAMTPDEMYKVVDTVDDLMRFHQRAEMYDTRLDLEETRAVPTEYGI